MCIDGNNAGHAKDYITAQVASLYAIAKQCADHYPPGTKKPAAQPSAKFGYDYALAEFYYSEHKTKATFTAKFNQPVVDFICDHDIHLLLYIKEGSYDSIPAVKIRDGAKASDIPKVIKNKTIALRVPFSNFRLRGEDKHIGNGVHSINTISLNYADATFIEETYPLTDSLRYYIRQYLTHLRAAGHHIFYSLPDFDNDHLVREINHSAVADAVHHDISSWHGISTEDIGRYIQTQWMDAAWTATSLPMEDGTKTLSNRAAVAVVEFISTWSRLVSEDGHHFHAKFSAPTVDILCAHEAVFYLNIDEIKFSKDPNFSSKDVIRYEGFKVAITVNIEYIVEEDGAVVSLVLDTSSRGKYLEALSIINIKDDIEIPYVQNLLDFLTLEYLQILATHGYTVIYRRDSRVRVSVDNDEYDSESGWVGSGDGGIKSLTTSTRLFNFDQIITLSMTSINIHFAEVNKIVRGTTVPSRSGNFFEASYEPMKLQLLSSKEVIVWVTIAEGRFKSLEKNVPSEEGYMHSAKNWRLAFLVKLDMLNHKVADLETFDRLFIKADTLPADQKSFLSKSIIKQIVLNFQSAQFLYKHSKFGDDVGTSYRALDKMRAAIYYIQHHYFTKITETGSHILYSIPVWLEAGHIPPPPYAFTDLAYHIYSKGVVKVSNFNRISPEDQPCIVIVGMCCDAKDSSPRKLGSNNRLEYSASWLMRVLKGVSFGTLALSSDMFLNGRLLPFLAKVNEATTVVPNYMNFNKGKWEIKLITWGAHEAKKNNSCNWERISSAGANSFEYTWTHGDHWTYKHEGGTHEAANGVYHLKLRTANRLSIPAVFRHGQLDITMKGETSISMGWETESGTVNSTAKTTWAIVLSIITDAKGLRIEVTDETKPESNYDISDPAAAFNNSALQVSDPLELIKNAFPGKIELGDTMNALKAFEGIWKLWYPRFGNNWKLGNPTFNVHGDLLLDLRPTVTEHQSTDNLIIHTRPTSIADAKPVFNRRPAPQRAPELPAVPAVPIPAAVNGTLPKAIGSAASAPPPKNPSGPNVTVYSSNDVSGQEPAGKSATKGAAPPTTVSPSLSLPPPTPSPAPKK